MSRDYDVAANRQRFIHAGCDSAVADQLVEACVEPDTVGENAPDCGPFLTAALHHGLDLIDERLKKVGGDPEAAWDAWHGEQQGDDKVKGPFVWGRREDGWVVLSREVAERHVESEGAADPRTIALDEVSRLEDELGDEFGEERQGLGGEPYLYLDEGSRDALIQALRNAGYEVDRDDDLFARLR